MCTSVRSSGCEKMRRGCASLAGRAGGAHVGQSGREGELFLASQSFVCVPPLTRSMLLSLKERAPFRLTAAPAKVGVERGCRPPTRPQTHHPSGCTLRAIDRVNTTRARIRLTTTAQRPPHSRLKGGVGGRKTSTSSREFPLMAKISPGHLGVCSNLEQSFVIARWHCCGFVNFAQLRT